MNVPTPNQKKAIETKGNLLIVAGAGAGKTRTLVQRCVAFLLDETNHGSLDDILMVTFTEAAAAEMRKRIRENLQEKFQRAPENAHLAEQLALLDSARICTLHSFCFQLVREHFYELELDPRINILPDERCKLLAREVLDGLMQEIYEGNSDIAEPVQRLVSEHGRGWDKPIRELVEQVHAYTQTLPDPAGWFAEQLSRLDNPKPVLWEEWFVEALLNWKNQWLPILRAQPKENTVAHGCALNVGRIHLDIKRFEAFAIFQNVLADHEWPPRKKTVFSEPLKKFFEEAKFLSSLCNVRPEADPLAQDWDWIKPQTKALLRLAQQFTERFSQAKRESASLDFQDLEQFALELLWNREAKKPTATAVRWREKLRLILVDEYQDINEAQDTILKSFARETPDANRFLVGDVKQSIYRFRLANPKIFLNYEQLWKNASSSEVIPLSDNFRSHEAILNFVNPLFSSLMKKEIGGIDYDESARLGFGNRSERSHLSVSTDPLPRVELHLRVTAKNEEIAESDTDFDALSKVEKEATLIGHRLLELKNQRSLVWDAGEERPVQWSDMVILLRSPRNKAEAFAKQFERLGIPLVAPRNGFYESIEVGDLLNLLRLLDNPLQDSPTLAVLRSPFVGLSLDKLAEIRMAHRGAKIWTALLRWREQNLKTKSDEKSFEKVHQFLKRFERWRSCKKQWSLSQLTETILDETHYADWLLAQERGEQRRANTEQFLELTRQFDSLQGQGLFRFIRFIESQQDAEIDLEPASIETCDAVRLMSIHQSKGLEFPIVVVAHLGKQFNFGEAGGKVVLDEIYGLCPQIMPPTTRQTYASLPYWLSQRRQKIETLGEELRLLYVATTRAADRLILFGTTTDKTINEKWIEEANRSLDVRQISEAKNYLDWIGPWFARTNSLNTTGDKSVLTWTIHNDRDLRTSEKNDVSSKDTPAESIPSEEKFCDLQTRLNWIYPFSSATTELAKTSVSALRRRAEETDEDARPLFKFGSKSNCSGRINGKLSASEVGTAHHTFLELVALDKVGNESDLRSEAKKIQLAGNLNALEVAVLDFAAIAAFWSSEIGKQILVNVKHVHREHPFTSRLSGLDVAKLCRKNSAVPPDEFVVLQGVIDIAVILPEEIWLLDFKSDQVKASEVEERAKYYRQQVDLYADAVSKIYKRRVSQRWLHFLDLRKTICIPEN